MRTDTPRESYLNATFGAAEPELATIRRDPISIAPHEARLLQFLIRLGGVRTVVEIGTLFGYSALAMAWELPHDGRVVTIERDPRRAAEARATFATSTMKDKLELREGDALDVLARLEGPFDMCFIDANKSAYPKYLDWAEANVRRGGLIVGDNTFLWGGVYEDGGTVDPAPMREFNRRLGDAKRYDGILIPTAEGLTVGRKLF